LKCGEIQSIYFAMVFHTHKKLMVAMVKSYKGVANMAFGVSVKLIPVLGSFFVTFEEPHFIQ
jgi:hypothetical protein